MAEAELGGMLLAWSLVFTIGVLVAGMVVMCMGSLFITVIDCLALLVTAFHWLAAAVVCAVSLICWPFRAIRRAIWLFRQATAPNRQQEGQARQPA